MDVQIVLATPELKARMRALSESNACDFVRFDDNYCSLFAVVGDRPVGLIVAKKRPLSEPLQMVEEAYIDIIEVQPDVQRRGIGTLLVTEILGWARENRISQVRAWSEEIRYEALMLWKELGFAFSQVDLARGEEKRYGFYVTKAL